MIKLIKTVDKCPCWWSSCWIVRSLWNHLSELLCQVSVQTLWQWHIFKTVFCLMNWYQSFIHCLVSYCDAHYSEVDFTQWYSPSEMFCPHEKYSHKIRQYILHQMKARKLSRSQSTNFCLQYLTVYIWRLGLGIYYKRKFWNYLPKNTFSYPRGYLMSTSPSEPCKCPCKWTGKLAKVSSAGIGTWWMSVSEAFCFVLWWFYRNANLAETYLLYSLLLITCTLHRLRFGAQDKFLMCS